MNLSEAPALYVGSTQVTKVMRGGAAVWTPAVSDVFADALAFWKLSDLTDATGNGNTLTNNDGVTFGAGKIGNAAVFDGSNWLSGPDGGAFSGAFSVSLWVKFTSFTGDINEIFGWVGSGGFSISYQEDWYGANDALSIADQESNQILLDNWSPSLDVWIHLIVVRSADNTMNLFVDGAESGSTTYSSTYTERPLRIGYLGNSGMLGAIDAAGVWNRALSEAEIATLYNGGTGLEPA